MFTSGEILQYTYDAVKALNLPINGSLYKAGTRVVVPNKESITVGVLNGTSSQVQEGTVNVNVFIPNVTATDGRTYCDFERCLEVEKMLSDLDKRLNNGEIYYEISEMIKTNQEPNTEEHFVNVSLRYKVLNY
jgi:hypothetical protein